MTTIARLVASIGFQINPASVRGVNQTFRNIEGRLNNLRQQFSRGLSFGNLRTGRIVRDLNSINRSLSNMHGNMASGMPAVTNYTTAIQNLAAAFANLRQFMPQLPRIPNPTGGAGGGGGGRGNRSGVGGFIGGLIGNPMGLAATLIPGVGLGWGIRESVIQGRNLQSTQLAYQALLGKEGGNAQLSSILEMSRSMKMDFAPTADMFKGLLASSVNVAGLGKTKQERAGKAQDIFRGVSSYGLALGLDDEKMKGALVAITQMMDKGQVYSEELRQQLAERMPGAIQILAKSMGVTTEQLYQMLKDGKVISAEVLPKMAAEMEKIAKDSGALSKYLTSSLAAQRVFRTEVSVFLDKIFKAGADEGIAKFFNMMTRAVIWLGEVVGGPIGKGIAWFFDLLKRLVDAVMVPVSGLVQAFDMLHWSLKTVVIGGAAFVAMLFQWQRVMALLNFATNPLFLFFTALYLVLDDIAVWMRGGKSALGTLFGTFEDFKMSPAWDAFFDKWTSFIEGILAIKDFIVDLMDGKVEKEVAAKVVTKGFKLLRNWMPGGELLGGIWDAGQKFRESGGVERVKQALTPSPDSMWAQAQAGNSGLFEPPGTTIHQTNYLTVQGGDEAVRELERKWTFQLINGNPAETVGR